MDDSSEIDEPSTDLARVAEGASAVTLATRASSPLESQGPGAAAAPPTSPTLMSAASSPTLAPTPTPSHCLGARGYDGGFYDVGSFFVFRHESQQRHQYQRQAPHKDKQVEDGPDRTDGSTAGAAPAAPSPLQYKLLDGVRVTGEDPVGRREHELEGKGNEIAGRVFVVLERQIRFIGKALGCTPSVAEESGAGGKQDEATTANGSAEASSAGSNNGAIANGKQNYQPDEQDQKLFALCNTEDNDSIQGLVRSGECLWIGRFGLPSLPPGVDESEMVDLWPRKVARVAEGRDNDADAVPLKGSPDAVGPLKAIKEQTGGDEALEKAQHIHSLLIQALAELRPYMPTFTRSPRLGDQEEEGGGGGGKEAEADPGQEEEIKVNPKSKIAGEETRPGVPEDKPCADRNGDKATSGNDDSDDTDVEISAPRPESVAEEPIRRASKRPRENNEPGAEVGPNKLSKRKGADASEHDSNGFAEDGPEEREPGGEGGQEKDALGAAKMTVAAVRASLLSNRLDEGPKPEAEEEEWEGIVKNFILHVESLAPGTKREELSLMFAAALDPTLVRMRAANSSLVELAEACCVDNSASRGDEEEEDNDDNNDDDNPDKSGNDSVRKSEGSVVHGDGPVGRRKKGGFKVRLELDAKDGEDPPPDGIAEVLRAVAVAAAAAEAAARAEACVAYAGDTLGGLRELRLDYKRSLPPGPREPIQFIFAEEQARVMGYMSAHEDIFNEWMEKLRLAGAEVGDAYHAVEREPGWKAVKNEVEAFLVKFETYCGSLLPTTFKPESNILGINLASARKENAAVASAADAKVA